MKLEQKHIIFLAKILIPLSILGIIIYNVVNFITKKSSSLIKSQNKRTIPKKSKTNNIIKRKTTIPQKIVMEQKGEIVNVMEKLEKLQKDVGMFLIKNTNADPAMVKKLYLSTFGCTPESISTKLNEIPPDRMMYFTLDGKTIQQPIMYMYNKDKKLFQDLDKSGILDFLGKIIGFTTWGTVANIKNYKKLEEFSNCVKNISFNNIEFWKYVGDDQQSQFLNCI